MMTLYNYLNNQRNGHTRILICRTVPLDTFIRLARTVQERGDVESFCAVVQKNIIKEMTDLEVFDNFITVDNRMLRIGDLLGVFLKKVKEGRYDLVLIPYNNSTGKGYFPWELLAFLSGKQAVGYSTDNTVTEITFLSLITRFFLDTIIDQGVLRLIGFILLPFFLIISLFQPIVLQGIDLVLGNDKKD